MGAVRYGKLAWLTGFVSLYVCDWSWYRREQVAQRLSYRHCRAERLKGYRVDSAHQLGVFFDLFERLGVEVRSEHLGGDGCNLCALRGKQIMFVDLDADVATRLDGCASAIAQIPLIDETFVPPEIRERIDRVRKTGE